MIARPKYPRVTILIPCFEAGQFVGDAIKCALSQTYGHVEVIVAPDDGDTYQHLRNTFKSPQLRIIPPGPVAGSGPGATRNRAIDAASGDYFAMLDADDLIPPTYVDALMRVTLVEGAAVTPTRYVDWDTLTPVRVPPIHNRMLSLSGFAQLISSIHPVIHRSLEPGYQDGFAEDVIHDGTIIAKMGTVVVVDTVTYDLRLRAGSLCGNGPDAELMIQKSYANRVRQILREPTSIGIQGLTYQDRQDFAELFRFRAMVSTEFSKSGAKSYNEWVAGKEAALWDRFTNFRNAPELELIEFHPRHKPVTAAVQSTAR